MKSSSKVIAIIVTYNGSQWIEKCLFSLSKSSVPIDTVVIDNASSDCTVELIQNKYPEVEIIKSGKNLGFGQANNIGLKKALKENADFVLLLNQDAYLATDTVGKLIRTSQNNLQYGILSPFHLNYEGTATERYFEEWVLNHYTPDIPLGNRRDEIKEVYNTSFVHAACWLMAIDTIKRVGGFDPLFFHYGEDNDYVQRLHFKGLHIGIVPKAKVFHWGTNEGLNNPNENVGFLMNQILCRMKSPYASHAGAVVLFIRQFVHVMLGKNSALKKAYKKNLKRIEAIFRARLEQSKPLAYLN